jgi:sirohydrochlorin cobaltochelatase
LRTGFSWANHLPVPQPDYSDAALVLVGHGSTKNADSAAPVFQHAAELRRRNLFAAVHEAFWKQEPNVVKVLKALTAPRVFIVPVFISEGYFSGEVIPQALGFAPGISNLKSQISNLYYTRPVGTHESMTNVLLARARDIVARYPFPRAPQPGEITLFLAGHGTEQNDNSRKSIEHQAALIGARNEYAGVHAVFMEEEPRIGECYALARTHNLVVVPFFISDGLHTQEDIPMLLGEPEPIVRLRLAGGQPAWRNPTERNGKLVWYAPAAGTEPHVADVILKRVREMTEESSL